MARRIVDLSVNELARLGSEAAREAASSASAHNLSIFGAVPMHMAGEERLCFVTVEPSGAVRVEAPVTPSQDAEAHNVPVRTRFAAG
jgi:hypothetical protein